MNTNKELFTLNPQEVNLKNEGVAKIRTLNEVDDYNLVEHELRTFVCEGEYHDGLKKILQYYLQNYNSTEQPGFWVSGFYGSGKSHLVKMASYLWDDFKFPNGKTARGIKPLPPDIQDLFVELERKQKVQGKLSIAGTLRDFPSKDIGYSFLQIFLNSLELPQQYHHFKFVYWAKKEGIYDNLKVLVEAAGKIFKREIENLYVSTILAKSVLELLPGFAENEAKVREQFRAQFQRVETISREDFVRTIKEEILPLKFGDKIPCTLIILDEVQQFIGHDGDLAFDLQLLAEDLCSRFDGKFLLVGTGQSALRETPNLQKLIARFRVPVQLSNTDIQKVIRKTILDKKASAFSLLNTKLEGSLGEISRNLAGTNFGYLTEDKSTLVADYPLLPSTRKFWYQVLKEIDTAGTSGQLRNQLRIIDDSLKSISDLEVGHIVPADFIFYQNITQLIQGGLLSNETSNIIQARRALGGDSETEGRILSAVFLIDQVTRENHNTGLKSNETTIADLLIDNLNVNSEAFRSKIKTLIQKLSEEKVLMQIKDEYKLQTKVGGEWEEAFSKHLIKLRNSGDDQIQSLRRERIVSNLRDKTKGITVMQGTSRTVREYELWDKDVVPSTEVKLNLWIRDGWYESEGNVLNDIRIAGSSASLAYIFVKKQRDSDLQSAIVNFLAAGLAINSMGLPSTPEGEQAKKSMETRQIQARNSIQEIVEKICDESTVYLAGGNIIQMGTLKENILDALNSIADRQFSDFKNKADYPNWGQVLNRAQTGIPDALNVISYSGDVEKHPVASEILRYIGNSTKTGKDVRNQFSKAPYGWPQDAIDAVLIVLKNAAWLSTSENTLNGKSISQATFKKEAHVLSAKDRIGIRKLFQDAGINSPSGQEFSFSNTYLTKLKDLAGQVGGSAPRPEVINVDFIRELENKEGSERLLDIASQKDDLHAKYTDWDGKATVVRGREPQWKLLVDLAEFAPDEPTIEELKNEIDAIRDNRLLLHEPDPIQPVLNSLVEKLGSILNNRKALYIASYDERMIELQTNDYFKKLSPEEKHSILVKHQLLVKPEIKAMDAQTLLNQLKRESLYTWDTKRAALSGQFESALNDAILLSAPQATTYSLPRRTIKKQEDIDTYLEDLRLELKSLLENSSSIILK